MFSFFLPLPPWNLSLFRLASHHHHRPPPYEIYIQSYCFYLISKQACLKMSSQAVSSTSTPLYRVFRGLKSTQAIIVPATEAEWLVTLNDFKSVYLAGRWKECEAKCTRLLEASKVRLWLEIRSPRKLNSPLLTCINHAF